MWTLMDVCACTSAYWYGFVTCWPKCWQWVTVEHEAELWRCDVMLRTGQRVVVVHVEVRCYATYWTCGRFTYCRAGVPRSSRFRKWNTDTRMFRSCISASVAQNLTYSTTFHSCSQFRMWARFARVWGCGVCMAPNGGLSRGYILFRLTQYWFIFIFKRYVFRRKRSSGVLL